MDDRLISRGFARFPERQDDVAGWLGTTGRGFIRKAGRVDAEIVVDRERDGNDGGGGNVAIVGRFVDHDARGFVGDGAGVVAVGLAIFEALVVHQFKPEGI